METQNKDKKIGVFAYEMIGTGLIMFALIIAEGEYLGGGPVSTTFAMMCLAYNVSGSHFNPAITLGMFIAEKDIKGNLITMVLMILGQFAGAFFGILLGWLAVMDDDY